MTKNRTMISSQTNFVEILNRTIDDTIKNILGKRTDEIYYHLKYHGIDSNRLGEDPEALERAMTEIFKAGWRVFRKAILRSFCQQLNLSMDKFCNHSFGQCIAIAEIEFLAKNKGSREANQVIRTERNDKLKGHENILKLSLPEFELDGTVKSCKLCGNYIDDTNNNEQLLAELCVQCWELQNTVWESPATETYASREMKYRRGDD